MKKISMSDIAREAGVGIATVDRVLNGRAPVRPETQQKVLKAAEHLGYREELLQVMSREIKSDRASVRTGFILLSKDHSFYASFAEHLKQCARQRMQTEPEFLWLDIDNIESMVDALHALAKRVDVIGLVALDHPLIRHTIKEITASGIFVYALFSDFSPCGHSGYIGLDNQKAGRTAGWFADRLLRQNEVIGILLGDHRFNCQESCEISFRSYLREQNSGCVVLEPVKTHESMEGGYAAAKRLLSQQQNLSLIYAPCGGIEGVLKAIKESGRKGIKLLCHGPVVDGDLALIEGDIEVMLRHRLDEIAARVTEEFLRQMSDTEARPTHITVPFDVITRENI
ncbi:LacI family transcriptional regulator [Candidatus Pantoea deserta]|uniref:LacI family transcriptional regulator n=1 Tax=Candidatus Pantoea deserta TaxID=1869313 RepID=A0A3N4NU93_9GAMM|nr:LacI family DNA-binding transcriptional regulator [Pantoea deserta]RPD99724.1 LacI family transcriptional regulator [Pantoea deserta]